MMKNDARNPTEQLMTQLALMWLEASEDPQARLFIWRVKANAESLVQAFIALQQQPPGDYSAPDLFISLMAPFDTGYGYSHALADELIEGYEASEGEQGWDFEPLLPCYSAAQWQALLGNFAKEHQEQLRYVVTVLTPESVSDDAALMRWLNHSVEQIAPEVRLMLIDTLEQPAWQALQQDFPRRVRLLTPDIDGMKLMQQTASQLSDRDSDRLRCRQFMVDAMLLLERGTPQQVETRAGMALAIARQKGWSEQQVVMHNIVGGAWLKGHAPHKAVEAYHQARHAAQFVDAQPLRAALQMQSAFGEGGAWFNAGEYQRAAAAYRSAAVLAQRAENRVLEIEGWRMAGHCLVLGGDGITAMNNYARAIGAARPLSAVERAQTTLPLALSDLLHLQDSRRAQALERCATSYQQRKSRFIADAENTVARHGATPAAVRQVECRLQQSLELSFLRARTQREQLIVDGCPAFRQIVAIGRQYLHPHWNGLPEIAHPFDAPPGQWQQMPQSMAQPDDAAGEFIQQTDARIRHEKGGDNRGDRTTGDRLC